MELPKNLASRYVSMESSASMSGDPNAAELISKLGTDFLTRGGRPRPESSAQKSFLRPGFLQWQDGKVSFNAGVYKGEEIAMPSTDVDFSKTMAEKYDISLGKKEEEFSKTVPVKTLSGFDEVFEKKTLLTVLLAMLAGGAASYYFFVLRRK